MKLAGWLTGAVGLAITVGAHRGQDDLLYEELGQRWLARNGVEGAKSWPELLETRFARLALGVFDIYLPVDALANPAAVEDVRHGLKALIEAQQGWAGWVGGECLEKRDIECLTKWLRSWTPKTLAGASLAGSEIGAAPWAGENVRSLLERYRVSQRAGGSIGLDRAVEGVRLVLFPRRAEFVEFTCVAGTLDPRLGPSALTEGLATWLEYEADDTRFLALEYGSLASPPGSGSGVSVGERNPLALSQLVVQVGLRSLLTRAYPGGLDPALRSGIANALVIELYGELDTRVDGDVRARSSEGQSLFVPGGNSEGGVLPATSAENRWRGTRGKDHFVGVLRQVQKQGGKRAQTRPEKLARFELESTDGTRKQTVSAPFLGAKAPAPPAEILPDYLEFVRCYGVAFLHWLRLEGTGKPADSAARFGEFLRALGRGARSEELGTLLEKIYGQPLSGERAEALFERETLEGRFLAWLART